MTVKAIIFDLGGVLLRTADFSPREKLAAQLGLKRTELEELIFGGESGGRVQRGEITFKEHEEYLRRQLNCSYEQLRTVYDVFFAEDQLDEQLVNYVRMLHQTYQTALLSNADITLRNMIAEKWHFEDAFDAMIISAEVGLAKPDPQIFKLTLDRLRVDANQAVFIDDMRRNVESAEALGLYAIQFHNSQQMQSELGLLLSKPQDRQ